MKVNYNVRSTATVTADMGEATEALPTEGSNQFGTMVLASTVTTVAFVVGQLLVRGGEALFFRKKGEGMDLGNNPHVKVDVRVESPRDARSAAKDLEDFADAEEKREKKAKDKGEKKKDN